MTSQFYYDFQQPLKLSVAKETMISKLNEAINAI